jgi:hypothetical protein
LPTPDYYRNHALGVKKLWDARMGNYTQEELDSFVKATWIGTCGNVRLCKALAGISILECGDKREVRDRTGHLGGHRKTIKIGALEAKIDSSTPYGKEVALSKHFAVLYYHYNQDLEKTCRVWNKGPKWREALATRYWNGVIAFSRIYDSARVSEVPPLEMAEK